MTPSDEDFQRLVAQMQEILHELNEFKQEARHFQHEASEQFRALLGVDGITLVLEHGLAERAQVTVMLASGFEINRALKTFYDGTSLPTSADNA